VKSNSNRNFFIYGSGRVNTDKVYERVTQKWRWGNFDQMRLYVDNSYGASVQAQQMIIWRATQTMISRGENQKAVEMLDAFFTGFPHMNFPFTARTLVYLNFYVQAGAPDKAKPHLRTLANEFVDFMEFYDSLDQQELQIFSNDYNATVQGVQELLRIAQRLNDDAFASEMQEILSNYTVQNLQN
jgi:hypothetical protein